MNESRHNKNYSERNTNRLPCKREQPSSNSEYTRLFNEFETYYLRYRCSGAPENPKRVFNFCLKTVYKDYNKRLTPARFMSLVYATLGIPIDEARAKTPKEANRYKGLFHKFDPAKASGKVPIETHFLNCLRWWLQRRVKRDLESPMPVSREDVEGVGRDWDARKRLASRTNILLMGIDTLTVEERRLIHLYYYDDVSLRTIGMSLNVDHKTVKAMIDKIHKKLETYINHESYN